MTDPCLLEPYVLAREVSIGRLSSAEVVDAFLSRIDRYDDQLHSFVDVYRTEARLAARAADEAIRSGHALGPFHGVSVAFKDLIEIDGRITTAGSAHHRDRRSTETGSLAKRLMAKGLIVIGKTHTVEFAYSGWGTNQYMGTPLNPWDTGAPRIPGGSSSGSGVAVAARLTPWAIGTDTGGSVRLPAAFCGLSALKPTLGRIETDGIVPLSQTLDTPGPITRSMVDAASLYRLMLPGRRERSALEPRRPSRRGVRGLRLGRMPEAERGGTDPEVLEAYDRSLSLLAELGAEIIDVELPFSFESYFPIHTTIVHAEAYANHHRVVEDKGAIVDDSVRAGILLGRDLSARRYIEALRRRTVLKAEMIDALRAVDGLLTPTTEMPALLIDGLERGRPVSRFTRFVNTLDLCAAALPNGMTSGGLPLSLQVVCGPRREGLALRVGIALQEVTDWHTLMPPI